MRKKKKIVWPDVELNPVPSAYMSNALTIWATEADTLSHTFTFIHIEYPNETLSQKTHHNE